ncbi:MAG: nucleotidyltransferase domain-containing protein [Planctomycetes bacterium]|nr:nucleotidyltransferase domain-containing protein [Planctomycetota bacterium]MBM4079277.1 nucleotidyltransferase domain-containing protein [Planctomycetota bacterium]
MNTDITLPEAFRRDIDRAVQILKDAGCTEVFVFGSLAEGRASERSDIDLAVRGCPKGDFFRLLGKLLMELDHPVHLVSLDREDPFAEFLQKRRELVRVD